MDLKDLKELPVINKQGTLVSWVHVNIDKISYISPSPESKDRCIITLDNGTTLTIDSSIYELKQHMGGNITKRFS